MNDRFFFHSFPRPRTDESPTETAERGLSILAFMKEVGLVLAPEVVSWDLSVLTGDAEKLAILQRRACFTEIPTGELSAHSAIFGPIAFAFEIDELRAAGATPVIYAPQGIRGSLLSQISTFCVRGAYHTREVLRVLQTLKETSDPEIAQKKLGAPLAPDCEAILNNPDGQGGIAAQYKVPVAMINQVLSHIGFRNIPFDHSSGVLSVFLNMFYPTDNTHTGDQLGYYRQREWRVCAGDIYFNGRPMGRELNDNERARLEKIDEQFWTRELVVDGKPQRRSALALIYDPVPDWKLFDLVKTVFVPKELGERARTIVGDKVTLTAPLQA